jgi:hypothetical protein
LTSNNTLSTLKFVTAAQPSTRSTLSPTERRRMALIDRIEEQIALATAQLDGKTAEFTRTVKNKETGQKETRSKFVRAWYWADGSKYVVSIKYGLHILQFAKGANAIEAPSLKGVVSTLQTIKQAAAVGELDAAITAIAAKREKKSNAK